MERRSFPVTLIFIPDQILDNHLLEKTRHLLGGSFFALFVAISLLYVLC